MDQPFLGHKAPRPGRARLFWCPACWTSVGPSAQLSSRHILLLLNLLLISSLGMCWSLAQRSNLKGRNWGSKRFWMAASRLDEAGPQPTNTSFWVVIKTGRRWTLKPTGSEEQAFTSWLWHGLVLGRTLKLKYSSSVPTMPNAYTLVLLGVNTMHHLVCRVLALILVLQLSLKHRWIIWPFHLLGF